MSLKSSRAPLLLWKIDFVVESREEEKKNHIGKYEQKKVREAHKANAPSLEQIDFRSLILTISDVIFESVLFFLRFVCKIKLAKAIFASSFFFSFSDVPED